MNEAVLAMAVIGAVLGVTCLVAGPDARRILRSGGFAAGTLALLLGAVLWIDLRGDGPATLPLILPLAYVLAGALGPPRPYLTGFLLSLVHLACAVLAFTLAPQRPRAQMDGMTRMGAEIVDDLLPVLIPAASGLVILVGTLVTGVSAGVRRSLHDPPRDG